MENPKNNQVKGNFVNPLPIKYLYQVRLNTHNKSVGRVGRWGDGEMGEFLLRVIILT
ncbi:MAG: hypothetical protein F6J90_06355 [Moorea sp. SIOASIH]|uniref:hypothetical protein n=1 Tax=Moorena sp. SIOASIH TaxID=2607817 RepID=UPI0013B62E6B|nr:hypothetical protein [Moorena sp. SIOASIH]NEO35968.1 hypothetical protein [Moorena sp. SIOASIH]NEO93778.1 hypothetical protein [Moorena sp. SIO3G5]